MAKELTDNQRKWLAALRSGDYKQGKRELHNQNGNMCCLGVAAVLFKTEVTPVCLQVLYGVESDRYAYGIEQEAVLAPQYVVEALGLLSTVGHLSTETDGLGSLTSMNDSGKSFAEIADIFEANLEAYTK